MPTTAVTAKSGTLAQSLKSSGSDTSLILQSKETWASVSAGVVLVGEGENREWMSFTGASESSSGGIYTITLTGVVRGLDKDATSTSDATSTNKKANAIGARVALVWHSVTINSLAGETENNTFSGANTVTGSFTFVSTTAGTLRLQNVTTAQRTALTGLANGVLVYDTDLDTPYIYSAGAWYAISTGSVQPDATETVKGVVELGTVTDQQNATVTGGSGAGVVVQTRYLVSSSAGAGDAYKIPILDANGRLDDSFMPTTFTKFGGDGSDGAIGAGALTITGSNNTYIVKNYTSFAPGNNTVTVTPTGCIVHIKVSGNADLTNTTFDFDYKGTAGGAGGAATTGSGIDGVAGTNTSVSYLSSMTPTAGGGGETTGMRVQADGGTAGTITNPVITYNALLGSRSIFVSPGAGGGGGASGNGGGGSSSGKGGDGGRGGGCLILEVAGNLTLSSTTINARGENGENAGAPAGTAAGSGGGGGGGGGTVVVLYGGTLTGSVTPQVTGGSGGALSTSAVSGYVNGTGGGGGASLANAGVAAASYSNSSMTNVGTAGGAGGNGLSYIAKNTVFQ